METARYYASAFFSHQAAEKTIKAAHVEARRELPPKTHNLVELGEMLGIKDAELVEALIDLNPEYAVSRYPDAANGVPAQMYSAKIAREHYEKSVKVVEYCRKKLGLD